MIEKSHFLLGVRPTASAKRLRYLMYADDTAIFIQADYEIVVIKEILSIFEKASNARVNWTKCSGLRINMPPPGEEGWGGRWLKDGETERYLGVFISPTLDLELMWQKAIETFADACKGWSRHHLSLIGRKTVLNGYLLPKLDYQLQALPLPDKVAELLDHLTYRFLWKGKTRGEVNRAMCTYSVACGGLDLKTAEIRNRAIKFLWITRLLRREEEPWARLARYYLENRAAEWGIGMNILLCRTPQKTDIFCPPFWMEALAAWQAEDLDLRLDELSDAERKTFPLWRNKWIKHGMPVEEEKILARKGVVAVQDLMQQGAIVDEETIRDHFHYTNPGRAIVDLIHAIPRVLLENGGALGDPAAWKELRKERKRADALTRKDLTRSKLGIPIGQIGWTRDPGSIDWSVWKKVWTVRVPSKWNELYWRVLHRALWIGERARRLNVRGLPTDCHECRVPETYDHLFMSCPRARELAKQAKLQWFSLRELLEDSSKEQRAYLWTVWKDRCRCVFEEQVLDFGSLRAEWERTKKAL